MLVCSFKRFMYEGYVAAEHKLTPVALRARKWSFVWLVVMIVGSIGLDQVTKIHAQDRLMKWSDEHDPAAYQGQRHLLWQTGGIEAKEGPYLSLSTNYVRNLGAAWGALSGLPSTIRVPFFYLVTCLAVFIIIIYMRSTPVNHRLAIFALALILSGAVGNFLDRLRLGFVIDWIDVRWNILGWRYDFPNFNFADSAITVGVTFLMIDMLILEALRKRMKV